MLDIRVLPLLTDNYGYLCRDEATGIVGVVDPSEATPVLEALETLGWQLDYILNTHHHGDHTGGNAGLFAITGARIVGARSDAARIPLLEILLDDGDEFCLGDSVAAIMAIPGHTSGHIGFYFSQDQAVFCGDTLFSLGCGKILEGDPPTLWRSLTRLRDLPDETRVYCGHEYTEANARFALTIDPDNAALRNYADDVAAKRRNDQPTIPSTIGLERAINPFLRCDQPEIAAALHLENAPPVEVFAALRNAKDAFKA